MTNLEKYQLSLFERCEEGVITEEERDVLLESADLICESTTNKELKKKYKEISKEYKNTKKNIHILIKEQKFTEAKKECNKAEKYLLTMMREIDDIETTKWDDVSSTIISCVKIMTVGLSIVVILTTMSTMLNLPLDPKIIGTSTGVATSASTIETLLDPRTNEKNPNIYKNYCIRFLKNERDQLGYLQEQIKKLEKKNK